MSVTTDLNIAADTGKRIAGSETTPLLELYNASTGPGLKVDNMVVTSTATIASVNIAAGAVNPLTSNVTVATVQDLIVASSATINSNATLEPAVHVQSTVISGPTQAAMVLGVASTASAPAIRLAGTAFVSCTSIDFTTAAVAGVGAIRVAHTDGDTLGWIPVMPDAAVDTVVWE